MLLSDIERQPSRAQTLSIVDSAQFKIALWFGSVSAGKTVASLFAFLLAVRVAPKSGLIVIVGKSLQTVYQDVLVLFQNSVIFGSRFASQIHYMPGATTAVNLGREVMIVGANDAKAVGRIQGATIALAYPDLFDDDLESVAAALGEARPGADVGKM